MIQLRLEREEENAGRNTRKTGVLQQENPSCIENGGRLGEIMAQHRPSWQRLEIVETRPERGTATGIPDWEQCALSLNNLLVVDLVTLT